MFQCLGNPPVSVVSVGGKVCGNLGCMSDRVCGRTGRPFHLYLELPTLLFFWPYHSGNAERIYRAHIT